MGNKTFYSFYVNEKEEEQYSVLECQRVKCLI